MNHSQRCCLVIVFVIAFVIVLITTPSNLTAQTLRPVFGLDDTTDVIDHGRFDSLWHASLFQGRLDPDLVLSDCYRDYRQAMETAHPDGYFPLARLAFWVNARYACLAQVMASRRGYRSTISDSMLFRQDTFVVAGEHVTVEDLADSILQTAHDTRAIVFLASGSTEDPPFPSHVPRARTITTVQRDLLRRILRSERFLFYDPGRQTVQFSGFFRPYVERITKEWGSLVQWALPYVTPLVAAALAVHHDGLHIVIADRIERWRRARRTPTPPGSP